MGLDRRTFPTPVIPVGEGVDKERTNGAKVIVDGELGDMRFIAIIIFGTFVTLSDVLVANGSPQTALRIGSRQPHVVTIRRIGCFFRLALGQRIHTRDSNRIGRMHIQRYRIADILANHCQHAASRIAPTPLKRFHECTVVKVPHRGGKSLHAPHGKHIP